MLSDSSPLSFEECSELTKAVLAYSNASQFAAAVKEEFENSYLDSMGHGFFSYSKVSSRLRELSRKPNWSRSGLFRVLIKAGLPKRLAKKWRAPPSNSFSLSDSSPLSFEECSELTKAVLEYSNASQFAAAVKEEFGNSYLDSMDMDSFSYSEVSSQLRELSRKPKWSRSGLFRVLIKAGLPDHLAEKWRGPLSDSSPLSLEEHAKLYEAMTIVHLSRFLPAAREEFGVDFNNFDSRSNFRDTFNLFMEQLSRAPKWSRSALSKVLLKAGLPMALAEEWMLAKGGFLVDSQTFAIAHFNWSPSWSLETLKRSVCGSRDPDKIVLAYRKHDAFAKLKDVSSLQEGRELFLFSKRHWKETIRKGFSTEAENDDGSVVSLTDIEARYIFDDDWAAAAEAGGEKFPLYLSGYPPRWRYHLSQEQETKLRAFQSAPKTFLSDVEARFLGKDGTGSYQLSDWEKAQLKAFQDMSTSLTDREADFLFRDSKPHQYRSLLPGSPISPGSPNRYLLTPGDLERLKRFREQTLASQRKLLYLTREEAMHIFKGDQSQARLAHVSGDDIHNDPFKQAEFLVSPLQEALLESYRKMQAERSQFSLFQSQQALLSDKCDQVEITSPDKQAVQSPETDLEAARAFLEVKRGSMGFQELSLMPAAELEQLLGVTNVSAESIIARAAVRNLIGDGSTEEHLRLIASKWVFRDAANRSEVEEIVQRALPGLSSAMVAQKIPLTNSPSLREAVQQLCWKGLFGDSEDLDPTLPFGTVDSSKGKAMEDVGLNDNNSLVASSDQKVTFLHLVKAALAERKKCIIYIRKSFWKNLKDETAKNYQRYIDQIAGDTDLGKILRPWGFHYLPYESTLEEDFGALVLGSPGHPASVLLYDNGQHEVVGYRMATDPFGSFLLNLVRSVQDSPSSTTHSLEWLGALHSLGITNLSVFGTVCEATDGPGGEGIIITKQVLGQLQALLRFQKEGLRQKLILTLCDVQPEANENHSRLGWAWHATRKVKTLLLFPSISVLARRHRWTEPNVTLKEHTFKEFVGTETSISVQAGVAIPTVVPASITASVSVSQGSSEQVDNSYILRCALDKTVFVSSVEFNLMEELDPRFRAELDNCLKCPSASRFRTLFDTYGTHFYETEEYGSCQEVQLSSRTMEIFKNLKGSLGVKVPNAAQIDLLWEYAKKLNSEERQRNERRIGTTVDDWNHVPTKLLGSQRVESTLQPLSNLFLHDVDKHDLLKRALDEYLSERVFVVCGNLAQSGLGSFGKGYVPQLVTRHDDSDNGRHDCEKLAEFTLFRLQSPPNLARQMAKRPSQIFCALKHEKDGQTFFLGVTTNVLGQATMHLYAGLREECQFTYDRAEETLQIGPPIWWQTESQRFKQPKPRFLHARLLNPLKWAWSYSPGLVRLESCNGRLRTESNDVGGDFPGLDAVKAAVLLQVRGGYSLLRTSPDSKVSFWTLIAYCASQAPKWMDARHVRSWLTLEDRAKISEKQIWDQVSRWKCFFVTNDQGLFRLNGKLKPFLCPSKDDIVLVMEQVSLILGCEGGLQPLHQITTNVKTARITARVFLTWITILQGSQGYPILPLASLEAKAFKGKFLKHFKLDGLSKDAAVQEDVVELLTKLRIQFINSAPKGTESHKDKDPDPADLEDVDM